MAWIVPIHLFQQCEHRNHIGGQVARWISVGGRWNSGPSVVMDDFGASYYCHTPLNQPANDALARVITARLSNGGTNCESGPTAIRWGSEACRRQVFTTVAPDDPDPRRANMRSVSTTMPWTGVLGPAAGVSAETTYQKSGTGVADFFDGAA